MGKVTQQTLFIVAGEHSGDLFASNLVKEIKQIGKEKHPDINLKFKGLGGNNLKKEGVILHENIVESLAIIGIVEVLFNIAKIRKLLKYVEKTFQKDPPDGVILVDYPGFNLRVAKLAKKYGIPVYYYVCPQVWAWHEKRITQIVKTVDELFTLFEFEQKFIQESRYFPTEAHNCTIHFIGHPILDILKDISKPREEIIKDFDLDPHKKIIGLLPGSRTSEVKKLLPVMLKAAKIIQDLFKDVQFIIPIASTVGRTIVDLHVQQEDLSRNIKLVNDEEYNLRSIMDFAIVASGTATLELSFLEIPMVIIYRINRLGYFIAKRLVNIKSIGLANIIFGEQLVPECIQDAANEKIISTIVLDFLTNTDKLSKIKHKLKEVKSKVRPDIVLQKMYGSKSPSVCAASIIWERLSEKIH